MPNRFVYPDLNFEHKDFRFGRATSIANLQRQSKKEIVEGKHITIEAVQGKRTEFKNIAGKAETSSITNANIWPPSGKSPIGSGGYEDCVDEAGKHSISSDDVNETGKGNSVRNFNEDGQPDYQTQKIREQLKEKKLQTDNKKGSQNEDGIPHLAGCKLAISMPFLTLQTVKSYRKLRQAIRLADEAQKLKGQGNFREARNSIFQSEIQHGCQLLKHTTKNCDKEKPDLIELSDLLEEVVKVSNIQIPNLKKLKKALKKIDRDDLPRKVLEWHERLQDAIDILEQPKDKDAHLKYSKYEALLEHYLTSSKEKGLHISRTIDQYFYSSLSDTSCRDIDQVIRRYQSSKLKERTQAKYKLDDDSNYNGDRNLFKIDKETEYNNHGKDQEFEMGMVDQLWMWVIDDRTIVTCFPQSIDKDTKSNRHDLLSRIRSHIHEERRPEISSIYHLASIITCLSVGLVEHCQAELPDGFESFFQIFTSSIAIVADKEVKRAEDFKKQLSRRDEGIHGLGLQEEIELLEEIKDIRDELSILQNICEEQQNILQKLFNLISRPPSETSQHIERDSVLSYYKGQSGIDLRIERIRKLQTDATTAYDSINHLLDLKQKDANIYEAVESRKQAEQTHVQAEQTRIQAEQTTKQGRTILVFTIVTIVFLPMSFLSSIFALNVRSFPHQNGDLSYPSKWIFSRICMCEIPYI
ncbi:hypothetical protein F5884DRAFT_261802 [Xylogone sp. PMI_703]|nr:hypothetical protein F5884DRAFT_261802 [Xylogone sp. PMI_703]